ncbi:hypothetical protein Tco_0497327 [Tanacetum coccineum]
MSYSCSNKQALRCLLLEPSIVDKPDLSFSDGADRIRLPVLRLQHQVLDRCELPLVWFSGRPWQVPREIFGENFDDRSLATTVVEEKRENVTVTNVVVWGFALQLHCIFPGLLALARSLVLVLPIGASFMIVAGAPHQSNRWAFDCRPGAYSHWPGGQALDS